MFPNEEKYKKAIIEYYESNATMTDLALKYNFDRRCFSNYLKKNGYKKKKIAVNRPVELYEKAKEYYIHNDISIKELSEKFKISSKCFSLYLKENNIIVRNSFKYEKKFFDKDFFEIIDTEEKAYWLGFLFADGAIRNNKRCYKVILELCKTDKSHLDKFIKALKSNIEIYYRKNRNTGTVQICSKKMVNDLISYGCVPNKTHDGFFSEKILNLDRPLKNAFIRGFFDGDGYVDKTRYRIILTMKSSFIMESLYKMLVLYGCRIVNKKSYYRLVIENKKGYYNFLDDIYSDATIFLDRKYEIYINRRALLNSTTTEDLGKQGGKSKEA